MKIRGMRIQTWLMYLLVRVLPRTLSTRILRAIYKPAELDEETKKQVQADADEFKKRLEVLKKARGAGIDVSEQWNQLMQEMQDYDSSKSLERNWWC